MWQSRVRAFLERADYISDADWVKTVALKSAIAEHRKRHPQDGLPRELFDRVLDWKLRRQKVRVARHLQQLTDQMIFEITGVAFRLVHKIQATEDRVKTDILAALPGVGLGVASAILTLYYPEKYGVIDFRAWDEVNEVEPGSKSIERVFTMSQYMVYLRKIRTLATDLGTEVQLVDFALWEVWDERRKKALRRIDA